MAFCFIVGSGIVADLLIAPTPGKVTWPAGVAYSPEDVTFRATDGINLKGWFLPQANSTRAVVLLHGVAASRLQMLQRALWLHDLGYNVFLYDARGCGESTPVHPSFGYAETKGFAWSRVLVAITGHDPHRVHRFFPGRCHDFIGFGPVAAECPGRCGGSLLCDLAGFGRRSFSTEHGTAQRLFRGVGRSNGGMETGAQHG